MSTKLYVGNLSWNVDSDALASIFAEHGEITDAIVLADRETGRSRGFGFVTFKDEAAAKVAMQKLDGADVDGRALRVNEAMERTDRGGGGAGARRRN